MAYLSVLGPLKDVVGAQAALLTRARAVVSGQCPDEARGGRGVGAVAADTALRLLSGRALGQLQPVEVHLVITDRALLGMGDPRMTRLASVFPAVQPEHLVYIGLRDLDDAEKASIRANGLHAFTMRDIDERGLRHVMEEALSIVTRGTGGVHVSCDADWVDPREAPGVGTPVSGGATLREAHLAMEIIHDSGAMVAMDLVEINPILDRQNHTAELSAELIASAFGRRIL